MCGTLGHLIHVAKKGGNVWWLIAFSEGKLAEPSMIIFLQSMILAELIHVAVLISILLLVAAE